MTTGHYFHTYADTFFYIFSFIFPVLKTFLYIIHNNYTFVLFPHISLQFCTLTSSHILQVASLSQILRVCGYGYRQHEKGENDERKRSPK